MEERRFSVALESGKIRGLQPPREEPIRTHNLCFLGFGNVNRTLVRLLEDRTQELRDRHGITFRITGIASRRLGSVANPNGFDLKESDLKGWAKPHRNSRGGKGTTLVPRHQQEMGLQPLRAATAYDKGNVRSWLAAAQANILFEAIPQRKRRPARR